MGPPVAPPDTVVDELRDHFVDGEGVRYRADGELGRGLLTCVARASRVDDAAARERYAVKTVLPLWVGHPLAEARIEREQELSRLIHCGDAEHDGKRRCARVLSGGRQQLGQGRSRPFHVAAWLDGGTLADRLREPPNHHEGSPPDAAMRWARATLAWADDLLCGLERLHGLGWVHRDVKPQNVFIEAGERGLLIDFGLAVRIGTRRVDGDEPFGTPAYVAPEVIAGEVLDERADLYCLGLLLYEALAGRRPFAGRDPVGLLDAHLCERPALLRKWRPALSRELERTVCATLEKPPGDRPPSAKALRALLRSVPEAQAVI